MSDSCKILPTLMRRDGLSESEALELIMEAVEALEDLGDPEEICYEYFGLEPDYVFDLLTYV